MSNTSKKIDKKGKIDIADKIAEQGKERDEKPKKIEKP